jgi:hypothetical protein
MPLSPRARLEVEEWRDTHIVGLSVSNLGRVRRQGNIVHTSNGRVGAGTRGESVSIAHLILNAFVGPCPEGMECCHWDDNRLNNTLSNIRWDTHSGNMQDRSRNGYNPAIGEDHGNAKLTSDAVIEMQRLHGEAPNIWTYTALSKMFHVTRRTVFMAVTRVTWRHVQ